MGIRKPGLWHGSRAVEIQVVNTRMAKACERCGDYPEERRLLIREGVGRGGKTIVHCLVCGDLWLKARAEEAKRAIRYLRTGKGTVRRG